MSETDRSVAPEPDPEQLFRDAFMRAYAAPSYPGGYTPPPIQTTSLSTQVLRRWWIVLLGTTVGALAGFFLTNVLPPAYTASITMIVQVPPSVSDTEAQVSTIEALAQSSTVLGDMAQAARTDLTPREVGDRIEISRPSGSAVVEFTVTDTNRRQARALAGALLPSLQSRLSRSDTDSGDSDSSSTADANDVTVRSFGSPQVEPAPSPRPRFTALGAAAGTAVGLLVAALLSSRLEDRRRRALQAAVVGTPGAGDPPPSDRRARRAARRAAKVEKKAARTRAAAQAKQGKQDRKAAGKDAAAREKAAKAQAKAAKAQDKKAAEHADQPADPGSESRARRSTDW